MVEDRLTVRIHDPRSRRAVGIDKIGIRIGFIIRALHITVTQRGLQHGKRRDAPAVPLQLRFALTVCSLDRLLNPGNGLFVRLRDDEGNGELRRAALDCLRFPCVAVAPPGVRSGDHFRWIIDIV